jgi:hypothetical protein
VKNFRPAVPEWRLFEAWATPFQSSPEAERSTGHFKPIGAFGCLVSAVSLNSRLNGGYRVITAYPIG